LGWRTRQLNGEFRTDEVRYSQLAALAEAGYLDLPAPADALPAHPRLDGDGDLDARARAALAVNCANCHRPGTLANAQLDLRAQTPLADTRACDVIPGQGEVGIADARLIAPGDRARSVLYQRMILRDDEAMPPIGSNVVDLNTADLVGRWITGLDGCP
jgi:hypothetical protein